MATVGIKGLTDGQRWRIGGTS